MRVTITTDGGFTGRGIGSASADVDDAFCARLRMDSWRESHPGRGADLVQYTLEIDGRRVTWVDGAEIPDDLRELFARVWATRP